MRGSRPPFVNAIGGLEKECVYRGCEGDKLDTSGHGKLPRMVSRSNNGDPERRPRRLSFRPPLTAKVWGRVCTDCPSFHQPSNQAVDLLPSQFLQTDARCGRQMEFKHTVSTSDLCAECNSGYKFSDFSVHFARRLSTDDVPKRRRQPDRLSTERTARFADASGRLERFEPWLLGTTAPFGRIRLAHARPAVR